MPATYDSIATTTLGSAAANITFSSIPSSYTDLRLVMAFRPAAGGTDLRIRFNGSSGTDYRSIMLTGNGTTVSAANIAPDVQLAVTNGGWFTANANYVCELDILSYTSTALPKGMLCKISGDENGAGQQQLSNGYFGTTNAISSITLYISGSANLAAGTTAALYGILRA